MINKESILLFTKDAFCTEYLPCYGNKYWTGKTPNIDELVKKGTLFTRFYTAAPSSAMAYMAMFTGKYPYEQEIKAYIPLVKSYSGKTLFDKADERGFECHVIWDEIWMKTSYLHSLCYGKRTQFHALHGLRQGVGFHYQHEGFLQNDKNKEESTLKMIEEEVKKIAMRGKVFVWFHLPHVINGRVCYGSDIDLHDRVLGIMRRYFDDSNIYISGDHGNMNGHKGKLGYGFDVYEPSIRIPLITPRKNGLSQCDKNICNIDWDRIIFGGDDIPERTFIISDSAYYAQPNRKTVVIFENFRYIYNKKDKKEELYDIEWDPYQNFNLMSDYTYDVDRKVTNISRELYFYPHWNEAVTVRDELPKVLQSIWRESSWEQDLVMNLKKKKLARLFFNPFYKIYKKKFLLQKQLS